ncbi:terpene synthase family protein [Streptomyces sp. NPDC000594]|uniref:terpene synthase family protein n=1 Tax=Streptomyces sp. NPDC000594 TaxID=3154261 RepID=UPI00331978AB
MPSELDFSSTDFSMPFPPAGPNQSLTQAEIATWQWIDTAGICQAPANRRYLRRTQPELVSALYYPHATPEVVGLIGQWTAFAFILDDEFDDGPAGKQPSFSAEAIQHLTEVMHGAEPTNLLSEALLDLWNRLTADRSASWRRSFRTDVSKWLWTYYAETIDRTSGRLPSIDEYQMHRIYSVGMPMYLDMCEIACAIDLPEPVRQLPAWRELRDSACQRVGLYNDLLSARKERISAYSHNAVFILEKNHQHSTPEAVRRVNNLVTTKVKKMISLEKQVLDQVATLGDEDLIPDILQCLTAYRQLVRGDHDYAFLSQRYMQPEEEQMKGAHHVSNLLGARLPGP